MTDSIGAMSSYGTSDELTDPFCDPCFKDGTIRPVAGYCPKCVEFDLFGGSSSYGSVRMSQNTAGA